MAIPCFVIVAAIAASSPAGPPKSAAAARRVPALVTAMPAAPRTAIARAVPEPPPMARGRRSAQHSIRRLVAE